MIYITISLPYHFRCAYIFTYSWQYRLFITQRKQLLHLIVRSLWCVPLAVYIMALRSYSAFSALWLLAGSVWERTYLSLILLSASNRKYQLFPLLPYFSAVVCLRCLYHHTLSVSYIYIYIYVYIYIYKLKKVIIILYIYLHGRQSICTDSELWKRTTNYFQKVYNWSRKMTNERTHGFGRGFQSLS